MMKTSYYITICEPRMRWGWHQPLLSEPTSLAKSPFLLCRFILNHVWQHTFLSYKLQVMNFSTFLRDLYLRPLKEWLYSMVNILNHGLEFHLHCWENFIIFVGLDCPQVIQSKYGKWWYYLLKGRNSRGFLLKKLGSGLLMQEDTIAIKLCHSLGYGMILCEHM